MVTCYYVRRNISPTSIKRVHYALHETQSRAKSKTAVKYYFERGVKQLMLKKASFYRLPQQNMRTRLPVLNTVRPLMRCVAVRETQRTPTLKCSALWCEKIMMHLPLTDAR